MTFRRSLLSPSSTSTRNYNCGSDVAPSTASCSESDYNSSLDLDNELSEHLMLDGFEPGTAESEASWRACKKNPGHPTFIPVLEFGPQHLPEDLRTPDVLEFIRLTAALTFRIKVDAPSAERPKKGFFSAAGSCVGTGFIMETRVQDGPCVCRICETGPKQQKYYPYVIMTAKHVIYDSAEAKRTTVEFNYDDEASRTDGRLRELHGVEAVGTLSHNKTDNCILFCVSHDIELGERVKAQMDRWWELRRSLHAAREGFTSEAMVAVAHPHGQAKQVTVGERKDWQEIKVEDSAWGSQIMYNTDTCPGSSGAPVVMVGKGGAALMIHSKKGKTSGLNIGSFGRPQ